jgi:hypothetical protein
MVCELDHTDGSPHAGHGLDMLSVPTVALRDTWLILLS